MVAIARWALARLGQTGLVDLEVDALSVDLVLVIQQLLEGLVPPRWIVGEIDDCSGRSYIS